MAGVLSRKMGIGRWRAGLASLLMAAVALFLHGCGRTQPEDGRVRLAIWSGWTGNEAKAFERLVAEFNRTHPGIVVENLGGVQDDTKTIRAITAGVPPDLFFLWSPPDLGPLVSNGAVLPLDSYLQSSGLHDSDFLPAALAMGRIGGRLYSLPLLVDANGLFWNRDVFRSAGMDPDHPPRTLTELSAAAIRLTRQDKDGNLLRLGLDLPDFPVILAVSGGRYLDPQGNPTADDPRNVAALQWYLDLVDGMGGIEKIEAFTSGYGQGQGPDNPFFIGKTAMMVSGEWIPYWIEQYAPHLDYGLAAVPAGGTGDASRPGTLVAGNPLCIAAESHHPAQAWEFLRWTQTRAVQVEFASALNNVPDVTSALDAPTLTQGSPRRRIFARFCQFARSPGARTIPPSPVMNYYLSEMQNALDFVLHHDKTPEQALHDVQKKVTVEMKRQTES